MGKVIDLTEYEQRPEILTSTALTGGLLGGGEMLSAAPLETYLDRQESPSYAARNTKAGLEIDREQGNEHIEPDDDLQALALLTDLRLLFVVGKRGGDQTFEIPLDRIVEVKSEFESFRTSTLEIHTIADERWLFRCTEDIEPLAERADELAQLWTHAQRLLDEAEMQVSSAERALEESAIDRAREELGDADEKVRRARNRMSEVGPAATDRVYSRASPLTERVRALERKLAAAEGARAHNRAQEAWAEQSYEAATERYERAIGRYETALSTEGTEPPQDALERRLRGAVKERELLRVAPLVDADTDRRHALATDNPEKAATRWMKALDGYRELLTLDWAKESREFVVDKEEIKEQTVEIADRTIESYIRAGRQWVHAADRLAIGGHDQQADSVYERATEQLTEAEQIAREVRPSKLDEIQTERERAETRRSEGPPDEPLGQPTPGAVDITGLHLDSDNEFVLKADEEDTALQSVADDAADSGQTGGKPDDQAGDETARNQRPEAAGEEYPEKAATAGNGADGTGGDNSLLEQMQSAPADERQPEPSGTTPDTDDSDGQSTTLAGQLAALTDDQFDTVVEELWSSQGWSTMSPSVQSASAFDILAMRDRPSEERLGLWTLHAPASSVEAADVTDCKETLAANDGADAAIIVTTAALTPEAEATLTDQITVVETAELCQLLRFEALADSVHSLAES